MSHADLIEKLEKLEGPDREADCQIGVAVDGFVTEERPYKGVIYCRLDPDGTFTCPGQGADMLVPRYTASLDAAVALVERVLPGCDICLQDIRADFRDGEARHIAEVMHDLRWVMDEGFPEPTYLTKGSGQSNSRPIALLIAALLALQENSNG